MIPNISDIYFGNEDIIKVYAGDSIVYEKEAGKYIYEDDSSPSYTKRFPVNTVATKLKELGGKSVVVNQLFNAIFNIFNASYGTVERDNNEYNVTLTRIPDPDTASYFCSMRADSFLFKANHQYLTVYDIYPSKNGYALLGGAWGSKSWPISANQWNKVYNIRSFPSDTTSYQYAGLSAIYSSGFEIGDTFSIKDFYAIDLTQMFGLGNEPTLDECKEMFSSYIPYNEGELITATPETVTINDSHEHVISTISLPSGIVLRSAGSAYDYIDFDNDRIVRNVGVVDLGSINWTYDSNFNVFLDATFRVSHPSTNKLLCELYTNRKQLGGLPWSDDFQIALNNSEGDPSTNPTGNFSTNTLIVRDSRFINPVLFKTAIQGISLYYGLATPTYEPIEISPALKAFITARSEGSITYNSSAPFNAIVANTITNKIKVV